MRYRPPARAGAEVPAVATSDVTVADLVRCGEVFGALADPEVMDAAWT